MNNETDQNAPASTPPKPPKVFFPNLDGWRFLAFFAVFFHHSFYSVNPAITGDPLYKLLKWTTLGGNLGVDFFFVLSGYLIIYLLLNEAKNNGRISIKNFYIRRVLRIFPLYYFCVAFGFVVFPMVKSYLGVTPNENANLLAYLFFLGNLDLVSKGILPDSSTLAVLWSIAIEEQFYLVIPIALATIARKYHVAIFVAVILCSIVFRALRVDDEYALIFHTLSFVGNLAVGGLAAYFSFHFPKFVEFFKNLPRFLNFAVYLSVVIIFFARSSVYSVEFLRVFDTIIIAILFAFIILEQNYCERSLFKMKNNRVFSYLGRYTYGLYCLHTIAMLVVIQISAKLGFNQSLWQVVFIEMPAAFLLTCVFGHFSFHYFEGPFLRLKTRFGTR